MLNIYHLQFSSKFQLISWVESFKILWGAKWNMCYVAIKIPHSKKIFFKKFCHGIDIFRAKLSDFRCCNIASTLMMLLPRLIYELIIHLSEFFSSMLGVQLKYKRYYIMELQFIPNFNSLYVCQLFKIFKYTIQVNICILGSIPHRCMYHT